MTRILRSRHQSTLQAMRLEPHVDLFRRTSRAVIATHANRYPGQAWLCAYLHEEDVTPMSIDLNQQIQQVPLRVASPQLVAANHILALSSTELQALIHREVEENPAIDVEEIPVCPQCSRPLQGDICPVCSRLARQEPKGPAEEDFADESG